MSAVVCGGSCVESITVNNVYPRSDCIHLNHCDIYDGVNHTIAKKLMQSVFVFVWLVSTVLFSGV